MSGALAICDRETVLVEAYEYAARNAATHAPTRVLALPGSHPP